MRKGVAETESMSCVCAEPSNQPVMSGSGRLGGGRSRKEEAARGGGGRGETCTKRGLSEKAAFAS
jgi:hypothetical protein